LQHPPHVAGPQSGGGHAQVPALQPNPLTAQSLHFDPPAPQASDSVPNRQSPASVQHPLQFASGDGTVIRVEALIWSEMTTATACSRLLMHALGVPGVEVP